MGIAVADIFIAITQMCIWAGLAGQLVALPLATRLLRRQLNQVVSGPIPVWSQSVLQESGYEDKDFVVAKAK